MRFIVVPLFPQWRLWQFTIIALFIALFPPYSWLIVVFLYPYPLHIPPPASWLIVVLFYYVVGVGSFAHVLPSGGENSPRHIIHSFIYAWLLRWFCQWWRLNWHNQHRRRLLRHSWGCWWVLVVIGPLCKAGDNGRGGRCVVGWDKSGKKRALSSKNLISAPMVFKTTTETEESRALRL